MYQNVNNFKPRDYQLPILKALDSGIKRVLAILPRRSGKDLTALNYVIRQMCIKPGVYYYIFPTYSQAKKVIWDSITNEGKRILDFFPEGMIEQKNVQEMKIRFTNGSLFQLIGSENYDSLMGTNPIGCVFSEYALQNPLAYQYLKPILTVNDGWALFVSTPRGKNHLWNLYEIAQKSPYWFCYKLTVDDTKHISLGEIEKEKNEGIMSEDMIQQEYYTSFERGVEGAYYSRYIREMMEENRICHVPYDKNLLVYTVWDLGFSDSTSIIFFQKKGKEILIIDYYEDRGYQLAHYLHVLKSKNYVYAKHYIPHDGKMHNNTGTTFQQVALDFGIDFIVLPKERSVIEGIERVRRIFPRLFIDKKKCEFLLKCLLQYHSEFNEKDNVFRNHPKHNWASHAADALRYMTIIVDNIEEKELGLDEWRALKQKQSGYREKGINDFFKPGW